MEKTAITIAIHRCHLLTFCPGGVGLSDAQKLVDLFHDLRLPTEHCDQGYLDANALESLVQRIGPPKTAQVKKVLLICGRYLEEQISFAVHYLLAKGYIIYLLRDLITAQSPEHVSIHDQRLLHAGAVSTTTRQLLYEWIASEANEGIKFRLSKVSFDLVRVYRPALTRGRAVVNRAQHKYRLWLSLIGLGPAGVHPLREFTATTYPLRGHACA